MDSRYACWLEGLAICAGIAAVDDVLRDQGLMVQGVVCHFICPDNAPHTVLVVVDAGAIALPADADFLHLALACNLQNFLSGSPQFLWDSQNGRLTIAQRFAYGDIEPQAALDILQSLALQAQAWQRREV